MIRVLHRVGGLGYSGLEAVVMNYYRNIEREKVQFDFIVSTQERERYDDEIDQLGGQIYRLPSRSKNTIKYLKELKKIIINNKYDIIHIHVTSASGIIEAILAKSLGVKKIIAHSHSSNCKVKLPHFLLKPFFYKTITHKIACSKKAGEWLYGNKKDVVIFNNAINCERYRYDEKKRRTIKKNLGFNDNDIIIGHIGRFYPVKNHEFLIQIFEKMINCNTNYKLILVGDDVGRENIEQLVFNKNLTDKVLFMGRRDDVNDILNIVDIFILPSLYEGLPLVLVEAQASGVKCIASTGVPKESDVTGLVEFISLEEPLSYWVEKIESLELNYDRVSYCNVVKDAGYDISKIARELEEVYLN